MVHHADTQYGFEFGSATVERICSVGNGSVYICVKSPKDAIYLLVTKTGKINLYEKTGNKLSITAPQPKEETE